MNINRDKKNVFYATDEQNSIIEQHRKEQKLTTSKQIRMLINYVFNDVKRKDGFNAYIDKLKKEV